MKALFLDFDGVLNGRLYLRSLPRKITLATRPDIDPACAERVQRICDATGASIVVTSNWREMRTGSGPETRAGARELVEVIDWLRDAGITAPVVGQTDGEPTGVMSSTPSIDRMHQISRYVGRQRLEWRHVCVLDDMDLHLDEQVRTDENVGITEADVERVITMLGRAT